MSERGDSAKSKGSRPASGRPASGRPQSGASNRPKSGASDRPKSGASDRPKSGASDRPKSGASGRPKSGASGRPKSSQSKAGSERSAVGNVVSDLTVKALQDLELNGEELPADVNVEGLGDDLADIPDMPDGYGNIEDNLGSIGDDMGDFNDGQEFTQLDDQDLDVMEDDFQAEVDDSGMEVGDSDVENNDDSDMIVLDPEHPLMKRFQNAYKLHLTKQNEKVTLELREMSSDLKNYEGQREELGVSLYGVQQELARQQMLLEKNHDAFNEERAFRDRCESHLNEIRTVYKQIQTAVQQQRKKTSDLQSEVENLASKTLYVDAAKEDVRSDIAILKRAANKTDTEITKAQMEKKKQDLLVNNLVSNVDHLREDIEMYKAQISAQREETKAATQTLSEATTELEAIELEKKQLLQQWNNSLLGMRKRDEAFSALQEAVSIQNQSILAIDTELDGYKRQIQRAQEVNEQLTYMHNRIGSDISTVKKQTTVSMNKQEALKIEYSTFSRTLHNTEQLLNKAVMEVNLKESEIVDLRKQTEKEFLEKIKLEDQIMEKMQEQLTADKASQYTRKMTDKIRRRATDLERNVADVENSITTDVLEIANATSRIDNLKKTLDDINEVITQKNGTISKIENEMEKGNAVIEKKQGTIDQHNKKIDTILSKLGDELYTGPLEFQIKNLQKAIEARSNECLELQQYWLRQQGDLVKVIRDVSEQSSEVESKKKQSTILLQKKLRMENEIESETNEIKDIERSIRAMQNDMTKLNMLIHKNSHMQTDLQQDNILLENDFIATLKDAELESIHLQASIQSLQEEKERLLNALVEAERQMMLWEKKTQLAKEARNAVDSEVGQGEIHAMRAEIHRMEVRFAQLMRQQEKMIQDMEKSVYRRENIIVRGDAQAKMERKKVGKAKLSKGTFHKKLQELKKKVKSVTEEASSCDADIKNLREQQKEVGTLLEEHQQTAQMLQNSLDVKDSEVEDMMSTRQMNLTGIIDKQQRAKYYTSLKAGKYTRLCKSEKSLLEGLEKHENRYSLLQMLVDRLNQEFPQAQPVLRKVTLSLGNRDLEQPITNRSAVELA